MLIQSGRTCRRSGDGKLQVPEALFKSNSAVISICFTAEEATSHLLNSCIALLVWGAF